jgi:two-component system LytT family response regulator
MQIRQKQDSGTSSFRLIRMLPTQKRNAISKVVMIEKRLKEMENEMHSMFASIPRIPIKTKYGFDLIDVRDVIRCEAAGNYTQIFLSNKKSHVVTQTLKQFELSLPSGTFIRSHQSHAVNIAFITSVNLQDGTLTLRDHTVIPISRNKKSTIKSILLNQK